VAGPELKNSPAPFPSLSLQWYFQRVNGVKAVFFQKQYSIFQLKTIDCDLLVLYLEIEESPLRVEVKGPNLDGISIWKLNIYCHYPRRPEGFNMKGK